MTKALVPKRVLTSRFAMTADLSSIIAKRIRLGGDVFHYGNMLLSGGCMFRVLQMIVKWNGHDLAGILLNIAIVIILLALSGGIAWGIVHICFVAIWRGTSGFYKRYDKRVMQGYVHSNGDGTWVELSKEIIFAIWYHMDNVGSIAAFLVIATTNTGGLMFLLRAENTLASLAVSFVIGALIMFMAIAFPITAGHIKKHASDLGDYEKQVEAYWSMQDITKLHAPDQMPAASNAAELDQKNKPELRSGNTVTGEFVDVPVDMEDFDDLMKGS